MKAIFPLLPSLDRLDSAAFYRPSVRGLMALRLYCRPRPKEEDGGLVPVLGRFPVWFLWFGLGKTCGFLLGGMLEAGTSARDSKRMKKKKRERGDNKFGACGFRELGKKNRVLCWVWLLLALSIGPQITACHGHCALGKERFGSRYDSSICPHLSILTFGQLKTYIYDSFFLFLSSRFSVSMERQWAMEESTNVCPNFQKKAKFRVCLLA